MAKKGAAKTSSASLESECGKTGSFIFWFFRL